MWNVLLFFLLSIHGFSGAETEETESVSVMEGDSVTLHTNLSEILNDDTILWMFGPKDSLISHTKRKGNLTSSSFTEDDVRFRGRLQVDQKTGSLTIRNTRIKHSGQYKLSISRVKTTIKIFNVTVFDMVDETDGVKSVSISVTEGELVTLRIDAELHKDALLLWRFGDEGVLLAKFDVETNKMLLKDANGRFRDRLKLDNQTGSLTIMNTKTTDSGLYQLQVKGSESSQQFLLSVNAVPDPGLSSGAIAGIILVPFLLLVVAVAGLIYYFRRAKRLKERMGEKKETVMEGESELLKTGLTEIQDNDTIEWFYETEDNRIAEINGGNRNLLEGADGRFRSKLNLDEGTGDLTISNIRTIHSGLYKLKIISSNSSSKTTWKRFSLTVNVRSMSVEEGRPVLFQTGVEVQTGDLILWTFGAENRLVVNRLVVNRLVDSGETTISERFRDRLELNEITGSLTIKNIGPTDAGHYKLQIVNKEKTTFRRFNVIVTDPSENQVNELVPAEMPLLNGDDPDGVNEEQSSV